MPLRGFQLVGHYAIITLISLRLFSFAIAAALLIIFAIMMRIFADDYKAIYYAIGHCFLRHFSLYAGFH
jgi:hypothetical protein